MPSFKDFSSFIHHIVLIIHLCFAYVSTWFVFIDKYDQCCGPTAVFGHLSMEEIWAFPSLGLLYTHEAVMGIVWRSYVCIFS